MGYETGEQQVICLLSHKCREHHALGEKVAALLGVQNINLQIDPFRQGDHVNTRERTFDLDALLFFSSPASRTSENCLLEVRTAQENGIPVFAALLDGIVPDILKLNERINWIPSSPESPQFRNEVEALGVAIHERIRFRRLMIIFKAGVPPDESGKIAQEIAEGTDRTVLAEHVLDLREKYLNIDDPTAQYWTAVAIGNAGTTQACDVLRGFKSLPATQHPFALEGVREALELIEAISLSGDYLVG